MFDVLTEMFHYDFLVRALIVGILVSLCAALLGVSLVLKRYSMIGDGLSHVGFGTLAIATAMNAAPLAVSIPVVLFAAFMLLRLSENSKIKGDAAIALISTSSLAIGVIIISLTTGMNTDVCNYLFGSILAMSKNDVILSVILAVIVLTLFVLFYNKIFGVTFDENFSKATGVKTGLYNMLIAFLTAITIVLGMRMMGALLISSLIIFPSLTSMRLCKKFKTVTICSALVSVICFFIGMILSYLYATPTGASIVLVNIIAFILFWIVKSLKQSKLIPIGLMIGILCCTIGCNLVGTPKNTNANGTTAVDLPEDDVTAENKHSDIDISDAMNSSDDVIEITEKMFIAQTNDMYINPTDYIGKTVKYEGIFNIFEEPSTGKTYYSVIRYGPGCCGYDANAGFEVIWDKKYPKQNDWVEVIGILDDYDENGQQYLQVKLTSLNTLTKRGAETVLQ
jgi:zinc transport system permease protein